jgi:hypothetical protein
MIWCGCVLLSSRDWLVSASNLKLLTAMIEHGKSHAYIQTHIATTIRLWSMPG